jgi:colanic acid biosynthesis glycosyl transferase WcaI
MLRIAVFDYPGHAFAIHLSRHLAERGHSVRHVSFVDFQAPKGNLESGEKESGFEFVPLRLREPFQKYNFLRRRGQEIEVGDLAALAIQDHRADVVLVGNAPIDAHRRVADWCLASGTPMVYWLQDINSIAIERILGQRLGAPGRLIGWIYKVIERRMLRASTLCVAITDDFIPLLVDWGLPRDRIEVIENWAPIEEIPAIAQPTPWGDAHGLTATKTFIYAGTLSLKHDPARLLALARRLDNRGDAKLVVASEGVGVDYLREHGADLASLVLLPFQPFDVFPSMLASADVLVAVLEPDAGVFSVPSKVLSYFCAGRPVLASIPSDNLAAKLIVRNQAGLVAEPDDADGFVAAAEKLLDNPERSHEMGLNARRYAEANFTIATVSERFERVLQKAAFGPISGGRFSGSQIDS